jgi:hypothetical protein
MTWNNFQWMTKLKNNFKTKQKEESRPHSMVLYNGSCKCKSTPTHVDLFPIDQQRYALNIVNQYNPLAAPWGVPPAIQRNTSSNILCFHQEK